uniref:Uncharacterized protein n=1 Tax=Rhizophora mucronata TaxID=61149 RepID=A0A2P2PAE0_RHIMU
MRSECSGEGRLDSCKKVMHAPWIIMGSVH